jgi:hypothetical protein
MLYLAFIYRIAESFETSIAILQRAHRSISDELNLHQNRCEGLETISESFLQAMHYDLNLLL